MSPLPEAIGAYVEEALALLDAVVAGELLTAAPTHPGDRERHLAAVRLIELAHRRLAAAVEAGEGV